MTADIELLPLPDIERYEVVGDIAYPINSDPNGDYVEYDGHVSAMADYARAVAEHNVKLATAELHRQFGCELRDPNGTIWDHAAKLQAEIEALRAERQAFFDQACKQADQRRSAESRAERLAEALRGMVSVFGASGLYEKLFDLARAALRDHDQEVGNG